MKIAFLIVAHGNIPQLNCFLRQLLKYEGSYAFIHLDKKAGDISDEIISDERIAVVPERISVEWGDYSIINATNILLEFAHNAGDFDWYSLHSGADMAIRPIRCLADFLEKDNKFYYGNFTALPVTGWGYKGGYGRLCLSWPDYFKKRAGKHSLRRFLRGMYGRLYGAGIIKGKKLPEKYVFYGGSEWFTASGKCIEKTLEFLKANPDYDTLFRKALSADEIYYNTVFEAVRNGEDAVSNNHLRYINWKDVGGQKSIGGPNTLSMNFIDDMEKSGRFFARKFDLNYDSQIVTYFEEKC